jgi:siroheme synthase (precorrin-2 oxidase/ferrochelatase)
MANISVIGLEDLKDAIESELEDKIKQLADEVLVDARANTPYKTGNARRNWNKKVTKDNFMVNNRVPYIERLEAGASKQAPRGIIGPTLSQIKGKV